MIWIILCGGVIGDDGADNLAIGPEEPEGQVYLGFQHYIKAHRKLGVLLNINSKNDLENALAGLNHPDSELHPDDFAVIRANWNAKDENFRQIAEELNILPESLVFVDDNPAERFMIEQQLNGVSAPEIGEAYHYIQNIDRNGYFEVTMLTDDDLKRNEMYKGNENRQKMKAEFSDYHAYLQSLGMRAVIKSFEPACMARIAQLTNKSNQFNLTTRRYTLAEIKEVAADNSYITLYGRLKDRFGDNGVVSVVIGHVNGNTCDIDLWLMSCRVLKRNMESAMMDIMVKKCKERGIKKMKGYYYPTAKNGMVKEFYAQQKFKKICEDRLGNTEWEFIIPEQYQVKADVIDIEL